MDLNNPDSWYGAAIFDAPAFDTASYQSQINSICGLNPFGQPNILLVWMPAMENYFRFYNEWDEAGFGKNTTLICQYDFENTGFPPPRWALKQFVHPSRYLGSDDVSRWAKKQDGQQTLVRELRPPKSENGYYAPFLNIGFHNGFCCKEKKKHGWTCFGNYREPDGGYLTLLKKAVAEREDQNPNEPLTNETLKRAALEAANEIKATEEAANAKTSAYINENLDSLLAHFTGDKGFLEKKKEFSFPATESGIILPL